MRKLSIILFALLVSGYSHAANNSDKLYVGGGLGLNSLSGIDLSDGLGFQFFAGYDLPVKAGDGKLSLEVGYMDSGKMEQSVSVVIPTIPPTVLTGTVEAKAKGLWGNAVYSLPLQDKMSLILRAGLDIGDDDGLMIGAGLGFKLDNKMNIRGEYVVRDSVDSLQVNLIVRM